MKEVRTGIRHILTMPIIYDVFQKMIGAYSWRASAMKEFVSSSIAPNGKLIDIGCGTAEALQFLPDSVTYVGFDRNEAYIEKAKKRYSHLDATFYCEELSLNYVMKGQPADVVLALGLVHHLDDSQTIDLFKLAKKLVKPGGFLLTLDPLYEEGQSWLAKYLISKDRGTASRTEAEYKRLALSVCKKVEMHPNQDPLRLPYTGIVMKCFF